MKTSSGRWAALVLVMVACGLSPSQDARADGKVMGPRVYRGRPYAGSLEERAQEAIIIFQGSKTRGEAEEDLILKIQVEGEVDKFAWIVPFPEEPKAKKEDAQLFQELHHYVDYQRWRQRNAHRPSAGAKKDKAKGEARAPVEVLSREIVGSYDVAVVREMVAGKLNEWLKKEGYQSLPDADDVIGFYRQKGYVFACIKVAATLTKGKKVDLHPLRFTFKTGGRDGIYFPMRLTGLQKQPFDVNLYVFHRYWLNDRLNKYGFVHRGFRLNYHDWDTPDCRADGGKTYSDPEDDPLLRPAAGRIPTLARLFQKLHPGKTYYLSNIQAHQLKPEEVREWSDDLWLFTYTRNPRWVPYDVRVSGPAAAGWPDDQIPEDYEDEEDYDLWPWVALGGGALVILLGVWFVRWRLLG